MSSDDLYPGQRPKFRPPLGQRSHFTAGEPGWEQVADYALSWATERARTQVPVAA